MLGRLLLGCYGSVAECLALNSGLVEGCYYSCSLLGNLVHLGIRSEGVKISFAAQIYLRGDLTHFADRTNSHQAVTIDLTMTAKEMSGSENPEQLLECFPCVTV